MTPDLSRQEENRANPVNAAASHTDGAERIRHGESLRDEQLRLLADNMPGLITYVDRDGRYQFVNNMVERWYGLPRAEIEGRLISELADPATLERTKPYIEAVLNGQRVTFENDVRGRHGQCGSFLVNLVPDIGPDGTVLGYYSLGMDITERKRTEEALKQANNILSAVFEGATDIIYVKDLEGRYVIMNAAGCRFLGRNPDEIIGKRADEIFGLQTAEALKADDQRVLDSAEVRTIDETIALPGGSRIFQTVKAPYRDAQDHIVGVIGVSRDVSEQRRQSDQDRFLAEAGDLLAGSLDYETRLANIARLAVPRMADWCTVHVLTEDETIEQLALEHKDPSKVHWAHELQRRFPPKYEEGRGLANVLRTGKTEWMRDIPEELLRRAGVNAEHNKIIRELGFKSYMVVPLVARGRILGAITFALAESDRHYSESDVAVAEGLAGRAAIYMDNTRLYRELQHLNAGLEERVQHRTMQVAAANDRLRREVTERQRAEELARALVRIGNKLNATLDLDAIMDELAQEAIVLVKAESGLAGLRTAEGMSMRTYFERGRIIPYAHTWHPGQGLPGWVLQHKQAYISNDAPHDSQIVHELPINAGIRTAICTPILDAQGEVIAFFDIRDKRDGATFNTADQDVLMALAPVASIAIQNALTYQAIARAEAELKASYHQVRALAAKIETVREGERIRIARELHDELGQALTALKFDLAWLTGRLAKTDETLQTKAKSISGQIDQTIKTVRRISTDLRPSMLDDFGLAASIEWQAKEFQERTGIECVVQELNEELTLTRDQDTGLFRIFQETLTNVARHANATRVDIQLKVEGETLKLSVRDNGRGIQKVAQAGIPSLGVLGMRERASLLGGKLLIASAPGEGTAVTVIMPLAQQNAAA
jgi:PAS domain S-box-containing protein